MGRSAPSSCAYMWPHLDARAWSTLLDLNDGLGRVAPAGLLRLPRGCLGFCVLRIAQLCGLSLWPLLVAASRRPGAGATGLVPAGAALDGLAAV